MKKVTMAVALLLLCSVWVLAQDKDAAGAKNNKSGKTTVEGCLSQSGSNYTLTDKSGTTYQLKGDTAQLSKHIGHEVKVKGTVMEASESATGASAGASAGAQQTLDVSSLKHISETCSASTSSGQSAPNSKQKPMSEKPY